MTAKPLSVTEVSAYIKALLDHDEVLGQLCVRGELSNYKMHSSGHHYFTLKDDGAVINAVMFRSDASRLPFQPENGSFSVGALTKQFEDLPVFEYSSILMASGLYRHTYMPPSL